MTDPTTIRAAAFELLHAHASMSAPAIATAASVSTEDAIAALGCDDRFTRVAGDGCWWWTLSTLGHLPSVPVDRRRPRRDADPALVASAPPELPVAPMPPPPNDGGIARAERQRFAARERIRGFLLSNAGGATSGRIRDALGLAGDEVLDLLRGLEALGEVGTYTMCDLVFWKAKAA